MTNTTIREEATGQSIADYAMVIAIVSAALLAMQLFVKRAVQAKLKDMLVASGYNNQSVAGYDVRNLEVKNDIESNVHVVSHSRSTLSITGRRLTYNSYSNNFQDGDEE